MALESVIFPLQTFGEDINMADLCHGRVVVGGKRRRRRVRSGKEAENQRMTHIAVEKNRRKEMSHHLACLRSLMPPSYVQQGDQASIIGGAINFVKDLEHRLLRRSPEYYSRADIHVTMAENHASIKIRARRRPRQLLEIISGLQSIKITVLHLTLATADDIAHYSLAVKVEEGCQVSTVDDIVAAMDEMVDNECGDDDDLNPIAFNDVIVPV